MIIIFLNRQQIIATNEDIENETLRATNAESRETIRAISAESNITASLTQETVRAMSAESVETLRAMSAESNLMQNQMNLQNASTSANAAMLAAFSKFELSTLAALKNLTLELTETKLELAQARASLASFQASTSSNNGACSGNASSLASAVFPDCPQGFSPSASSTPTCPGSNQHFPTTFSCQRKFHVVTYYFYYRYFLL